jgi:hypothetical protein
MNDKKIIDTFIETIVGECGTELKEVRHTCSRCGMNSTLSIPVDEKVLTDNDYAKLLLKRQRDKIKDLHKIIDNLVLEKEETKNITIKQGKVYNIVVEDLRSRGRTWQEANVIIKQFMKEQNSNK